MIAYEYAISRRIVNFESVVYPEIEEVLYSLLCFCMSHMSMFILAGWNVVCNLLIYQYKFTVSGKNTVTLDLY